MSESIYCGTIRRETPDKNHLQVIIHRENGLKDAFQIKYEEKKALMIYDLLGKIKKLSRNKYKLGNFYFQRLKNSEDKPLMVNDDGILKYALVINNNKIRFLTKSTLDEYYHSN